MQQVHEASGGKAILEKISQSEAGIGIMGMAAYFRLTRETPNGPVIQMVILAQNGFSIK